MTMPKRPSNRDAIAGPDSLGPVKYVPAPKSAPAQAPEVFTRNARLSSDETSVILGATLLTEHHADAAVLQFIASYVKCRDSKQASREAGINASVGYHLLRRPDIHLAIKKLTEKSLDKYGFSAEEIVERVKEVVQVDPAELERPDGTFKTSLLEIAPEVRRAIRKFEAKNLYENDVNGMPVLKGQLVKIEFWDKLKAAEMLGPEKEVLKKTQRIEHDVTEKMGDVLLGAGSRADARIKAMREASVLEITGRVVDDGAGKAGGVEADDLHTVRGQEGT